MNKTLLRTMVILFLVFLTTGAFANGLRSEIALDLISINSLITDTFIPFLPIPEFNVYYAINTGLLNFGFGLRSIFAYVELAIWPDLFAELDFGAICINAHVGGGIMAGIGVQNFLLPAPGIISDLSVALKFTKSFRLAFGFIMISPIASNSMFLSDEEDMMSSETKDIPSLFYISAKWLGNYSNQ